MNVLAGLGTASREALGGGFVALRREDGSAVVASTRLAAVGVTAMMTAPPLDARDESKLCEFIERWSCVDPDALRQLNQVHSAGVVPAERASSERPDGDGLWTRSTRDVLVVRSADCAVLWLVDPKSRTLAMAHAGWRGVLAGIVGSAVRAMRQAGADPAGVHAAVGPHLRSCCFEIGPEVAGRFARYENALAPGETLRAPRQRGDGLALDLSAAIRADFAAEGVPEGSIDICPACTRCRADLFHSYRRNGPGGPLMASLGSLTEAVGT